MEMNPFKPLIQIYEGFQVKSLGIKTIISKLYLKVSLVKATT